MVKAPSERLHHLVKQEAAADVSLPAAAFHHHPLVPRFSSSNSSSSSPGFNNHFMYLHRNSVPIFNGKVGQRTYAQRINHIWSERERRKDMQNLYDSLRSLLPQCPSSTKLDRCGVVGETMQLIQTLRLQIEELSRRRALLQNNQNSAGGDNSAAGASVTASLGLHMCDSDVFVNMSCSKRPRMVSSVLWVLRQHQLILQDATVSVTGSTMVFCIHCKALNIKHLAKESLQLSLQTLARA